VERIAASREFAQAERMCRFLRTVVARTLAGETTRLKEYAIGVEVFDRPESFDPGIDPIVRVEARRLRDKLRKYYETAGRHDEIFIELPKGGYVAQIGRRPAPAADAPEAVERSIVVLPFQNLSPSSDAGYFSDGLTWELIHQLTRTPGLRVVAWNSAVRLRDDALDLKAIGEKLKVSSILVGSARLSTERLRVVAQLVEPATGRYLWSETYERAVADVLAIQVEISRAIVSTLRGKLAPAHEPLRVRLTRYQPEAYRLYLRGRAEWNLRTEPGLRRSIEHFSEAALMDPHFALAYAGLADAYALLADYGLEPPSVVVPRSKAAAQRALEIDSSLGEAHASLALLTGLGEWKWEEAEAHYRQALDLNPGYATAHHWLSTDHLALLGRTEEALEEIEIARQLDPLPSVISEGYGYILMLARRYEESAQHLRQLAVEDPAFYKAHTALGRVLLQMRRYDEAHESLQKGWRLSGNVPTVLGAMGQAYALQGRTGEARKLLADLETMARGRFVPSTCFALIHLGLGDKARALDWLEKGAAQQELPLAALGAHPAYDDLRQERRFAALLARIGLAR
jgi:TolB-like protein/Tfp pilus assembly protein PilF